MIQANELRIGNYLQKDLSVDDIVEIQVGISDLAVIEIESEMGENHQTYFPIPLTEEWLMKFGFSKKGYKPGFIGIDVRSGMIFNWVLCGPTNAIKFYHFEFIHGKIPFISEINYVHQLQNFFFALTGQELTVKN